MHYIILMWCNSCTVNSKVTTIVELHVHACLVTSTCFVPPSTGCCAYCGPLCLQIQTLTLTLKRETPTGTPIVYSSPKSVSMETPIHVLGPDCSRSSIFNWSRTLTFSPLWTPFLWPCIWTYFWNCLAAKHSLSVSSTALGPFIPVFGQFWSHH